MTTTQHTPGSWIATRSGSKTRVASIDTGKTIAAGATAEDGRLIAAAPDLLALAAELAKYPELDHPALYAVIKTARELVAKATQS